MTALLYHAITCTPEHCDPSCAIADPAIEGPAWTCPSCGVLTARRARWCKGCVGRQRLPRNPWGLMWLDGEIGRGRCDHDVCLCGSEFRDVHGYLRSSVEHSGVWRPVMTGPRRGPS